MKNRLTTLPGTPRRIRHEIPDEPELKVDFPTADLSEIVPSPIEIEIGGGRSSTASAMRAARVQQALEEVGATGCTIELEGEWATMAAEADRQQLRHIAKMPFVRRIRLRRETPGSTR